MQDPFEQFENPMGSSMSCEMLNMSDEERKSLRASASPFYPDREQNKLDAFTIRHSLAQLRDDGRLLIGITSLIDNLSTEHKAQLLKHISSENSNLDLCQDVEQYQKILDEVKSDRQKLRSTNKQNLQHIENLERSLQNLQYKIGELQKQQLIDKEFFESFEKKQILNNSSNKKCSNCSEKNFSKGRAAAEREPLRQKPMKTSGWVEFNTEGGQKPIQQKKVFEYKGDTNKRSYGTYNEAAAESSAEMDSYSVVPITMPERSERLFNAPQRKSKQKRSYNQSAISKFSDQQIDSSKMI